MPTLRPGDPRTLRALLETYGTADTGVDPEEIEELLEQADEEIREAEWDHKGGFPNGVLKSVEMAILKMALALALGYCRRLARRDEFDPAKGARAHRNAALLLWFWARDEMPEAEPIAAQLVDIVAARNSYGYEGMIVSMTEADDFTSLGRLIRRPVRLEAAVPVSGSDARPKTLAGFDYTHQITPQVFDRCRDDIDYTVPDRAWQPPMLPRP